MRIERSELQEKFGKGHLSYSSLKYALGDILLFDQYMKGLIKYKSSALDFGTMYDMMLFEPDKAYTTYVQVSQEEVLENCSAKTRSAKAPPMTAEYKAEKKKLEEALENKGKILVTPTDWNTAQDMILRLMKSGLKDTYLKGRFQVEFNEDLLGVPIKGFLDCLGSNFISDSKSTQSIKKFKYSVRDFNYDIQAYIYTQVFGITDFYWVVQEKTEPYTPALVKCSDSTLFAGEMNFHSAVRKIRWYLDQNEDYDPKSEYLSFEV